MNLRDMLILKITQDFPGISEEELEARLAIAEKILDNVEE